MQTFLPYPDLKKSISCLDPKRLGNQVYRECKTLVSGGWRNHPASRIWRGYESALCKYALYGFQELTDNRDRHYPKWYRWFEDKMSEFGEVVLPPWLGNEKLHSSHRSALLFKDPEWYSKFGWSEDPIGPDERGKWQYYWPVNNKIKDKV